jgi:hypothetical protein
MKENCKNCKNWENKSPKTAMARCNYLTYHNNARKAIGTDEDNHCVRWEKLS